MDTITSKDVFTPEDMDTNQKLIAKIFEEFLRGDVGPRIQELEDKAEGLMIELLKKAAAMGWQGVDIPKEFGGLGLDKISSLNLLYISSPQYQWKILRDIYTDPQGLYLPQPYVNPLRERLPVRINTPSVEAGQCSRRDLTSSCLQC